jgi:hypothetical protein
MVATFTAYKCIPNRSFFDDPTLHPEVREREASKGPFPVGAIRRHEELIRRYEIIHFPRSPD